MTSLLPHKITLMLSHLTMCSYKATCSGSSTASKPVHCMRLKLQAYRSDHAWFIELGIGIDVYREYTENMIHQWSHSYSLKMLSIECNLHGAC